MRRRSLIDSFWEKVNKNGSVSDFRPDLGRCWIWTGNPSEDYGRIKIGGAGRRSLAVHRLSWTIANGPIPEGLDIDHLCRVRKCVCPSHLEPVLPIENFRRGMQRNMILSRAGVCHNGHSLSGENVRIRRDGMRACRACESERGKRRRAARRLALETSFSDAKIAS